MECLLVESICREDCFCVTRLFIRSSQHLYLIYTNQVPYILHLNLSSAFPKSKNSLLNLVHKPNIFSLSFRSFLYLTASMCSLLLIPFCYFGSSQLDWLITPCKYLQGFLRIEDANGNSSYKKFYELYTYQGLLQKYM
jgi:hypothetical protein